MNVAGLASLVGLTTQEVQDSLVPNILGIQDEAECRAYLTELLGTSPAALDFINQHVAQHYKRGTPLKQSQLHNVRVVASKPKKKHLRDSPSVSEKEDDEVKIKKNRHECGCYARKHALYTNCLACGRILCVQEGAGPCFYCNAMVSSRQTYANADSAKAVEHKQRLLEFQRTSEQRTRVIDQVSDYSLPGEDTAQDLWLSKQEKQARQQERRDRLHELEHSEQRSGKARVITLDLQGKVVKEERKPTRPLPSQSKQQQQQSDTMYARNPLLLPNERPIYISTNVSTTAATLSARRQPILQHDWVQQ